MSRLAPHFLHRRWPDPRLLHQCPETQVTRKTMLDVPKNDSGVVGKSSRTTRSLAVFCCGRRRDPHDAPAAPDHNKDERRKGMTLVNRILVLLWANKNFPPCSYCRTIPEKHAILMFTIIRRTAFLPPVRIESQKRKVTYQEDGTKLKFCGSVEHETIRVISYDSGCPDNPNPCKEMKHKEVWSLDNFDRVRFPFRLVLTRESHLSI